MKRLWGIGLGILLALGFASAQAEEKAKAAPAADKAPEAKTAPAPTSATSLTSDATKGKGPQKPREINFEDETIRGTLTKPEGDFIESGKRGKQRSLIKIRRHFVPELLKSADDL